MQYSRLPLVILPLTAKNRCKTQRDAWGIVIHSTHTLTHMWRYAYNWLERSNISGGSALKAKPTQTLDAPTNAFLLWRSGVAHEMYLTTTGCRVCDVTIIFKNIKLDQKKWCTEVKHNTIIIQIDPELCAFFLYCNDMVLYKSTQTILYMQPQSIYGVFFFFTCSLCSVPVGGRLSRCDPALSGMSKGCQHLQTLQLHQVRYEHTDSDI